MGENCWERREFGKRPFYLLLQLLKWVISNTLALPPMDTYQIVSVAGWVINLIIIEMYIRFRLEK